MYLFTPNSVSQLIKVEHLLYESKHIQYSTLMKPGVGNHVDQNADYFWLKSEPLLKTMHGFLIWGPESEFCQKY